MVALFVIHNFNRYTTSVNCCWKYSIATIRKLLNTQKLEPVTPQTTLVEKNWSYYKFGTTTWLWDFGYSHDTNTFRLSHQKQVEEQAPKPVDWICFLLMLIWEVISCLIYIYPKSLYCIVGNRASCSAAYSVYKLLYKSDYFTSSWYLIRWVCNSISAFIHLPGWPFHLNYGLRLSITLYFWFCNYSPRSDIFLYNIGLNILIWDSFESKLYIPN